jgi:hypothetical protein
MKHLFTISVCTALLVASGVWAGSAIQLPAVTYGFEGGACGISDFPEISTRGNKTRLKLLNRGWMVSEDPRLTGPVVVDVEIFINNINGHVGGHGSFVLQSSDGAGTWEADFNIHAPGGKNIDVDGILIVKDSQMNARGTGAFEGQWFFFSHGLAVNEGPYEIPVESPEGFGCEFLGEIWSGTILNPNAT